MVYNGQQIKMKKKIALIVSLVLVNVFGINCAYANTDSKDNCPQNTTVSEISEAEPYAQVTDVSYDLEKNIIKVTVCIKNPDGACHRAKVTPTDQISGVVVEGSQHTMIGGHCDGCKTVTFHCDSVNGGDAKMCRAYNFKVELID